jgi:glycosyltransferase involved in cell wall biosynthesis
MRVHAPTPMSGDTLPNIPLAPRLVPASVCRPLGRHTLVTIGSGPLQHEDDLSQTRVALIHEHTWPAVQRGGERYLHDLAWYLDRHTSTNPTIVTARGRPRHDDVEGIPVNRTWDAAFPPLGRMSRRLPRVSGAVAATTGRRALAPVRASVVHALSPGGALAAARADIPFVFTTLGAPTGQFAERHPRRWAMVARAASQAAVVTAVGHEAAVGFADALGRAVEPLPPGIRLDGFPPVLTPRTGPPRILFASAVGPNNKGFAGVLEALPAVLKHHPDARLVVLGPGDVDARIAAASSAVKRVAGHVDRVLAPTADMPSWYGRGTVTVLASHGEAFGLVLAESLACGTPIVASTSGGPAEILEDGHGVVGHPATPHDPDSIAEALVATISLAADPSTPAACRGHAEQWGWLEAIGPRHRDLYASVASA